MTEQEKNPVVEIFTLQQKVTNQADYNNQPVAPLLEREEEKGNDKN